MSTDSITARYLAELDHPVFPLPESYSAKIRFAGRYLSRPVFLEARVFSRLERDLSLVWRALSTLPQRLYDGDLTAFARAVGMPESQVGYVMRSRAAAPCALTHMARADLYQDATGFRLLEWNLGSTVGGVECTDMCQALSAVPEIADFLAKEDLGYADTHAAVLDTLRSETGYPAGTAPVVAVVETPEGFSEAEAVMDDKAARWADRGLLTTVGHLGELVRSHGRLLLRGTPVDVVYRMFTIEDMLPHVSGELLEPLLSAAEREEVTIFSPLDSEVYGSKGALALLSDPDGQTGLTREERDACLRLVPWTRQLRAGEAYLEDGTRVDLISYVLEHQNDLVLKPSLSYGGNGVMVGADPDITPATWRSGLAQAVDGSYVVQRLVRPVPELFPSAVPGRLTAWTVAWGAFMMRQGYAGMVTRAVPAETGAGIVNFTKGALVGCGFHAQGDLHD